jgi:hypothetical protein
MRRLLRPHRVERFARRDLGRRIRHVSGRPPAYYSWLFSRRELDAILWSAGEDLRRDCFLIESGRRSDFPRKEGADLRDWLGQGYRRGATVIVNHLERRSPAIAAESRAIERALVGRVDVTAVLTPPRASGFDAHYDGVDALVLQIEGEKRWRLHPPVTAHPVEYRTVAEPLLAPPIRELTLRAGDFLHVPRGLVHRAWTTTKPSLHLTIGVYAYRWVDLIEDVIEGVAQSDLELRRRVAGQDLHALLKRFRDRAPAAIPAALARRRRRIVATSSPMPGGALAREPAPFDGAKRFAKPAGTRCHVEEMAGRVAIEFTGDRAASVRGPLYLRPALDFIARVEGPFGLSRVPGALSVEEKRTLVRRLVADGLLEVVG